MHKLSTSAISNLSRFPIKQGTLDFLQFNQTDIAAGCINLPFDAFNYTDLVYIYTSFTDPFATGLQGYVFCYNDASQWEYLQILYTGDPINPYTSPTIVNAIYMGIFQRQYLGTNGNADPVTFTDGTVNNVHNFRFVRFSTSAPVVNTGETLLKTFTTTSSARIFQIMNEFIYNVDFRENYYNGDTITLPFLRSISSLVFAINCNEVVGDAIDRAVIKMTNGSLDISLGVSSTGISIANSSTAGTLFVSINNLFNPLFGNFVVTRGVNIGGYVSDFFPLITKRFANGYYQNRIFDSVNFGVNSITIYSNGDGNLPLSKLSGFVLSNTSTYSVGVYINSQIGVGSAGGAIYRYPTFSIQYNI